MSFFSKIRFPWVKEEQPKKVKKTLTAVYEMQEFDIGVTTVLVIFRDGREVHTKIYGEVDQYVRTHDELVACPPYIATSLDNYRRFIQHMEPGQEIKVVDDPRNPAYAWVGHVSHVEIVETHPYLVQFTVTKIVES